MSEPKHTPGPWLAAQEGGRGNLWNVRTELEGQICRVSVAPRYGEREANARLIAAAPALLATLVDLLERAEQVDDELTGPADKCYFGSGVINTARAAIRQARGED